MGVRKKILKTKKAPLPIGPYSQGVKIGNWVFISGQGGIDPRSGTVVEGGVRNQTRQALENIKSILEAANLTMDDVVKVTVFLRDIKYYSDMNDVYREYFNKNHPARTTIQATPPGGIDIEVEVIAYKPE